MLKKIMCLIAITFVWSAFDVFAMDTVSELSKPLDSDKENNKSFSSEELNNKQLEMIIKSKDIHNSKETLQDNQNKTV
jgi:hypothetical protein